MRAMSGSEQFTADGKTSVFPVTIPSQPDTNYQPFATIEYVSGGPLGNELDGFHVTNLNPTNFRVVFFDPIPGGVVFNVHWLVCGV